MKAMFVSRHPSTFAAGTALIFIFTSAVFLIYDRSVERRQKKVVWTAALSAATAALLEEKVRERTQKLELSKRKVEDANRRIQESAAAQLEHFASMSHEIRTPLNCIIGLSSLLIESDMTPADKDSVAMIVNSGHLLRTIVDDVLDYSKLESGNVDIVLAKTDLQLTFETVLRMIGAKCMEKNLELKTHFDASVEKHLTTDGRRIQQIMFNLLGNSVKFSKIEGTVEFNVSFARPDVFGLPAGSYSPRKSQVKGTAICLSVKDYGKGISQEGLPKIFKAFQQEESTDLQVLPEGTGLGVTITTKLVHRLGGDICVASELGKWTEFNIYLPFSDDMVDREDVAWGFMGKPVIIVEDHDETANRIRDTFAEYSIETSRLYTIEEALAKVSSCQDPEERLGAVIANERLCQNNEHAIESLKRYNRVLATYGPCFSVKNSSVHFRSILQTLPSVVVSQIVDKMYSMAEQPHISTKLLSVEPDKPVDFSSVRVLIAEDNKVNQKVLTRLLAKLGVLNVEIAGNGQIAVDMEASTPFDVVFMDAQMPVMDGCEACRLICSRRREAHDSSPDVVFVTAQVSEAFRAECEDAGASMFLAKPCTVESVGKCLNELFTAATT